MEKKLFLSLLVIAAFVIAIGLVYFLDSQESTPTGNIVAGPDGESDFLEIGTDELSLCCTLPDGEGCYALKGKDCSYCSEFC